MMKHGHPKVHGMLKTKTISQVLRIRTKLLFLIILATQLLLLVRHRNVSKSNSIRTAREKTSVVNPGNSRHPTIGMGQRRSFSNHFCVGPYVPQDGIDKNYGTPEFRSVMRSCHFTDVCFDVNATLFYYIHENDGSVNASLENDLVTCLHGHDFWIGPDHVHPKRKHVKYNKQRWLRPQIVYGSRPQSCAWAKHTLAIPYLPSHVGNFGHCLLDNVMSFYRMMKLFDVYSDEMDFVPLRMFGSDYEPGKELDSEMLSKTLDPFLGYSMRDSAKSGYFSTYFAKHVSNPQDDNACLCFENLISGKYMHTDHGLDETQHGWKISGNDATINPFFVGRGDLLREFRDAYMRRVGLDPNLSKRDATDASIIVIPRTPGGRIKSGVWDHVQLIQQLSICLESKGVLLSNNKIAVLNVESMSVEDQIRATSSAKVLISMRGGGSILSVFLPRGATLLLLERNEKQFDDMLYDNIPYFHVVAEPVLSKTNSSNGGHVNTYNHWSVCEKVKSGVNLYDMAYSALR